MIKVIGRTRNIFLIIGGILILLLCWYFRSIIAYILLSVLFSFLGRPLVRWIQLIKIKKIRISKTFAALITLLAIWIIFLGFFRFMIPLLISEFEALSTIDLHAVLDALQEPLQQLTNFFGGKNISFDEQSLYDLIQEQITSKFSFSQLSNVVGFIAGIIGELIIAFFSISFITFFFLKEDNLLRDGILLIVPSEIEEKVGKILNSISYLLRRYFIGIILEVIMVMLLDTLGLTIIGIEFNHAVVIGLFCGLLNVIPYLGPWLGASVGILIGTAINLQMDFMSHTLPLLGLLIVVIAITQVIDNVLFQPLIYSSSVKAHPLEIFLVILAAGTMAGIPGMILAIPVYTIIRVIAKEFFDNMKIVKKITNKMNISPKN